jgi:hypothetical protein
MIEDKFSFLHGTKSWSLQIYSSLWSCGFLFYILWLVFSWSAEILFEVLFAFDIFLKIIDLHKLFVVEFDFIWKFTFISNSFALGFFVWVRSLAFLVHLLKSHAFSLIICESLTATYSCCSLGMSAVAIAMGHFNVISIDETSKRLKILTRGITMEDVFLFVITFFRFFLLLTEIRKTSFESFRTPTSSLL